MDDEALKQRFDQIEKAIAATDKRVDETKLYVGGVAGLFTIWFAVLTVVLSSNYNSDKASLRDFQRDLRQDLGKSSGVPELELLGPDGKALEGQELEASFRTETKDNPEGGPSTSSSSIYLHLTFGLKNAGTETTGPMTTMLYTGDAIKLFSRSIDENDFKYALTIDPKHNDPSELPAQLTLQWGIEGELASQELPLAGKYPALLKFFYGKGKVKRAKIILRVPPHP
jgi:hypothetical protein